MRNWGFIRGAGIKEIYGFLGFFRATVGAKQKPLEKRKNHLYNSKYFLSATAVAYGEAIRAQPLLEKGILWFPGNFFVGPPIPWEGEITVYSPVCQHLFTEFARNICRCMQNCKILP